MQPADTAMLDAANKAQKALAMLIAPDAIKATSPMTAFAAATEAEVALRAALTTGAAQHSYFFGTVPELQNGKDEPAFWMDDPEGGDPIIIATVKRIYRPELLSAIVRQGKQDTEDRTQPEPHPDDIAVDNFAAAMKAKLAAKRAQGFGDWHDPEQCTAQALSDMLRHHVAKGDPVDVANLAMMLHQRGEAILPIDDATDFDSATLYWRDMDPEDSGDHPQTALNKGLIGHYIVCAVSSSHQGPTRFGFSAPVLDPESDDDEFLHFATEAEALAAAQERCAIIEARDRNCPVCNEPMNPDDLCATDISLGICHAACLEGAPTVDLDTGEQIDAPIQTYRYGDLP